MTIPDHIKEIPEYCFAGCEYLSKVRLGPNIEKICSFAFAGCKNLIKIENLELIKKI